MSVGILIITHGSIGKVLLQAALDILGECPLPALTIAASSGCDPERVLQEATRTVRQLDRGDGVLVLTDMYGATPSNVACRLPALQKVRVVSGLNLPMLVRVLNYSGLELEQLATKALSGGREGVTVCRSQSETHAE
jgi:PTS system mannose-specific IIA component